MPTAEEQKNIYIKALEEYNSLIRQALTTIMHQARNHAEYGKTDENKIEQHSSFKIFSDRNLWIYYGILNADDMARLALLEHLLSPDSKEVRMYSKHKLP